MSAIANSNDNVVLLEYQNYSIPCGNTEEHYSEANEIYSSSKHEGILPILLPKKDDLLILGAEKCTK